MSLKQACYPETTVVVSTRTNSDPYSYPQSTTIVYFLTQLMADVIKRARMTTFIIYSSLQPAGIGVHFSEVTSLPSVAAGFKTLWRVNMHATIF